MLISAQAVCKICSEDVFSHDTAISLIKRLHNFVFILVNELQHVRCLISILDRRSVGKGKSKVFFLLRMCILNANLLNKNTLYNIFYIYLGKKETQVQIFKY